MKTIVFSTLLLSSTLAFAAPVATQPHVQQQQIQRYHYQAPQPMTEEILKQRLDMQLSMTKRQMAIDKKLANAYAANFARFQKQQAAALQQMMKQAEKQREYTLKRLEMQQQLILDSFSKFQIAQDKIK